MTWRLLAVTVLALAAPAQAALKPLKTMQLEPKAKQAAASITGAFPHRVDCSYAFRGGDGFAQPAYQDQPAVVWVKPYVCRRLNSLWRQKAVAGEDLSLTARALLVLIHESIHVSSFAGARDEALTECRALQLVSTVAARLGADEHLSAALGRAALAHHVEIVSRHPQYGHPECRDGGELDIGAGEWPNP